MTINKISAQTTERIIDIKSGSYTFPVLSVSSSNINKITQQLLEKIKQAPDFFKNAPLIIALSEKKQKTLDLAHLIIVLRDLGFIIVGISGGSKEQQRTAKSLCLAILANTHSKNMVLPERNREQPKLIQASLAKAVAVEPVIITQPVRSGQRVIAEKGDLIVLASVSSGAELLANNNIHIYGHLRGRALAGINGNKNARIFCAGLEAELVSIAGIYKVPDQFFENVNGKPAQIFIENNKLIIQSLQKRQNHTVSMGETNPYQKAGLYHK